MNYMRAMKVLAVLVALASTAGNGASELEDQYKDRYEDQYKDQYEDQHKDHCEDQYEDRYEDQYEDQYYVGYVGLNFGTRWGESFKLKPSVVFGYHHNQNSKFELEVLADISDITDKEKRKVVASLLANYLYYPDLEIDPVRLYASVGLGGYPQIIPFGFGVNDTANDNGAEAPQKVPQFADESNNDDGADTTADSSLVDKILSSISYKVKLYQFPLYKEQIDNNGKEVILK